MRPPRDYVPPILAALAGALVVVVAFLGSRRFRDFDSALVGYAVGLVFAFAALVYRYALWLARPPTWRYFRAGWANFLSLRNFLRYARLIPLALWTDIFGQTFLWRRSPRRWAAHFCIFWGVILSLAITVPLTLGWIRFTLVPPEGYQLWVFGVAFARFPIASGAGFFLFHALDFTAVLVIVGVALALARRVSDLGLLAVQRYGFDLLPLVLLFAIAVTGLALTASTHFWQGRYYGFVSLTHEIVVVAWLLSIPFAKFFHIVERPASIGVTLYQTVNQGIEHYKRGAQTGSCRRCGRALPSARFVADLTGTLQSLEQDYDLGEGRGRLQEYCPTCKRVMRGQAYYRLLGRRFL